MSCKENDIIFEQILEKCLEEIKDPDKALAEAERRFEARGLEI